MTKNSKTNQIVKKKTNIFATNIHNSFQVSEANNDPFSCSKHLIHVTSVVPWNRPWKLPIHI